MVPRSESFDVEGRRSTSLGTVDEDLAPVEYLREQSRGTAIVVTDNHKPLKVKLTGWYADPRLRALVDPEVARRFDRMYAPQPEQPALPATPRKVSA